MRTIAVLARPLLTLCLALSGGALLGAGCSSSGKTDGTGGGSGGTAGSGTGGLSLGEGGETNTGGSGQTCGGDTVAAETTAANLLFVIDRSGSMDGLMDSGNAGLGTRWEAMVSALNSALAEVPAELSVGLQFFPDGDGAEGCDIPSDVSAITVPIGPSSTAAALITNKLEDSAPGGNTPTADALQLAYEYFTEGPGATLTGKSYVLLALDGGPNCNASLTCGSAQCTTNVEGVCPVSNCCASDPGACLDDDQTLAKVEQLASAGIKTLVVGIPGSDAPTYVSVLNQLAVAGGAPAAASSPRYYKVDDPTALTNTLKALTLQLITSCVLQLESAPPDKNRVNVFIDDEVLPQAGADGWELDESTSPPSIVIKGATCEAIESTGAESVRIEFGCPTVVVR